MEDNLPEEENKIKSGFEEIKEKVGEFVDGVKKDFEDLKEDVEEFFDGKPPVEAEAQNTIATPFTADEEQTEQHSKVSEEISETSDNALSDADVEQTQEQQPLQEAIASENLTGLAEAGDENHDSATANGGAVTNLEEQDAPAPSESVQSEPPPPSENEASQDQSEGNSIQKGEAVNSLSEDATNTTSDAIVDGSEQTEDDATKVKSEGASPSTSVSDQIAPAATNFNNEGTGSGQA